jgi:hypothetical protein
MGECLQSSVKIQLRTGGLIDLRAGVRGRASTTIWTRCQGLFKINLEVHDHLPATGDLARDAVRASSWYTCV